MRLRQLVLDSIDREQRDYLAQYILVARSSGRRASAVVTRVEGGWFIPREALAEWCKGRKLFVDGVLARSRQPVQETPEGYVVLD